MYLGIDIGGSKTLLAGFSEQGQITAEAKFATPADYNDFLALLESNLQQQPFKDVAISHCCCAVPGEIDRSRGVGLTLGNLPWENKPVKDDLSKILPGATVLVENDSNLAGLSEALLVHDKYKKVLYLTISTGIGDGIIINGIIDPSFADSESGQAVLNYGGELHKW